MDFPGEKSFETAQPYSSSPKQDEEDTNNGDSKMLLATTSMSTSRFTATVWRPGVGELPSMTISSQCVPLLKPIEATDKTDIPPSPSESKASQSSRYSEGPEFVKLKTSQKRRFKIALAQGLSRAKALAVATSATKSAPSRSISMVKTKKALAPKKLRSSGIVNMGIVPLDLWKSPFTEQAVASLQEAIIDAAIETGAATKPEFEGCHSNTGWLKVVCSNPNTADWLRANAGVIKNKSHLEFKVIEECDFPKPYYVQGLFPNSQGLSNEKILVTIEAQNNLKASSWKVLQRKGREVNAIELTIEVDFGSWERLKECSGRIAYRFGHIALEPKDNRDVCGRETQKQRNIERIEEPSRQLAALAYDQPCTSHQAAGYGSTSMGYANIDQSAALSSFGVLMAPSPSFRAHPYPTPNRVSMPDPFSLNRPAMPSASLSWQTDTQFHATSSSGIVSNSSLPFTRRSNYPRDDTPPGSTSSRR